MREVCSLIRFYIAARLFWWAFGLIRCDLPYATQYAWVSVAENIAEASAAHFGKARHDG
jgi:hypothetical protein